MDATSTTEPPDDKARVAAEQALREVFDRHGYSFQFSVINECLQLRNQRRSSWWPDGVEFPVAVNGTHLHVDFVLRGYGHEGPAAALVVECKRVNPKFARWCFGRSNLVTRANYGGDYVTVERIWRNENGNAWVTHLEPEHTDVQYHVSLEARTTQKGDPTGGGRGALQDATTQVLRATNGIIVALGADPTLLANGQGLTLTPVIVTTAELVVCNTDLSMASRTGELPDAITTTSLPWLWLRVVESRDVRQSVVPRRHRNQNAVPIQNRQFDDVVAENFARSVAVVTFDGLAAFLGKPARFHAGLSMW